MTWLIKHSRIKFFSGLFKVIPFARQRIYLSLKNIHSFIHSRSYTMSQGHLQPGCVTDRCWIYSIKRAIGKSWIKSFGQLLGSLSILQICVIHNKNQYIFLDWSQGDCVPEQEACYRAGKWQGYDLFCRLTVSATYINGNRCVTWHFKIKIYV